MGCTICRIVVDFCVFAWAVYIVSVLDLIMYYKVLHSVASRPIDCNAVFQISGKPRTEVTA